MPNIDKDVKIEKPVVRFYNFRSMVVKLAKELKAMVSYEPMDVIDSGSSLSLYLPLPKEISVSPLPARYDEKDKSRCDLLKGM